MSVDSRFYKVLFKGKSCNGGNFSWSLPTAGNPGKWHKVTGDVRMCINGFHLTKTPFKWFFWGGDIYEAEGKGMSIEDGNKAVFRYARLLRKTRKPSWLKNAERFIGSIKSVPWFVPDSRPLEAWELFYEDSWDAARDSARDSASKEYRNAAWYAARDAAKDAASKEDRNAAWDAAKDAAKDAVWDAARDSAWDLAWDLASKEYRNAAWYAARDAARDASLSVVIRICSGLNVDAKHIAHSKARWQVWEKGYALLCDVNKKLYVYAKGPKP